MRYGRMLFVCRIDMTNSKILGCLLGGAIGDSSGATLEFFNGELTDEVINRAMRMPGGGILNVANGQYTDDTELSLAGTSKQRPVTRVSERCRRTCVFQLVQIEAIRLRDDLSPCIWIDSFRRTGAFCVIPSRIYGKQG